MTSKRPWKGKESEMIQAYLDGVRVDQISVDFEISKPTLYGILKSAGIEKRGARESIKYDQKAIASDYLAGLSLSDLVEKYNFPHYQVLYPILEREGIRCERTNGPNPLSMKPWNYQFFDRDTSEVAYWAGFLMADGSLKREGENSWNLSLNLHEKDVEHIYAFCDAIGLDRTFVSGYVSRYRDSKSVMKSATVYHPHLVDSLYRWGIVERKTYNFVEPAVPDSLLADYLRGWLDGDGHITGNGVSIGVTGNYESLVWYAAALRRLGYDGGISVKRTPGKVYGRLIIGGRNQVNRIAELLKAHTSFRLARKWDKLITED